jgi:hypothetical protein
MWKNLQRRHAPVYCGAPSWQQLGVERTLRGYRTPDATDPDQFIPGAAKSAPVVPAASPAMGMRTMGMREILFSRA